MLVHYSEGVRGCGRQLELALKESFFDLLEKICKRLEATRSP